jgi:small subunit ribosomal protein S6
MRKYESLFIFHPEVEDDKLKAKIEEVKKYVTSQKGKVENIKEDGRVNLAYPIKKCQEGINVTFDLDMPAETVDVFRKKFTKDEKILRYTILRK